MAKPHPGAIYVGAYLIEGDERTLEKVIDRLVDEGIVERGDPDLFLHVYRSFGIDDARDLRDRAHRKAVAREGRIFAFFAPGMTSDAQNALLKVIEEPPAGALFFIVVPSPRMLLPTLISRVQLLRLDDKKNMSDADAFLSAPPAARMEMVKEVYEHDEDEGRDMAKVLRFLQSLEMRFAAEKPSHKRDEGLQAIYRARKYAGDKGSLLKALLEQVALLTPRI